MSTYHLDAGLLPNLARAACRGVDPDLFFTDGRIDQAKSICAGCHDRLACLGYALASGVQGVWGGTDDTDRRQLSARLHPAGRPDLGLLPIPRQPRVGTGRSRGSAAPHPVTPQAPWTDPVTPAPSGGGKRTPTPPTRPRARDRTPKPEPAPNALLTVDQAADLLGTGTRFIRRIIAERRIAYVKVGKYVRISAGDLAAFVADGRQEPLRVS